MSQLLFPRISSGVPGGRGNAVFQDPELLLKVASPLIFKDIFLLPYICILGIFIDFR